ncbi:hypothetical protein TRFO_03523 [Tritrichomonas foetus]|uniref:non-specific serine/threonine protein kinase n=1 Tax=Tritrichomonas foetus TaxID=1144522 RepID=A0A1J4KTJ6_9EUKA|nr:hypothetical protein TRFO_03523 [Tritrichomonas foetus]|eukprot:OHT13084.1 hypothetical protein TRFO_03523 [Tritrichomonas foetus]
MEYLPGGDLYSLLQNLGTLDEEVARVYTFQIAIALSYLHSHGIIHRDIKPDNILVDAEGFLKLTDFGLSYIGMVDRKKAKDDKVVESSSMVGTPDYIAPEIVESKAHSFTVDWWSLGVMLYEFLYGEPPFHADSEKQIYDNIVNCNYSFPTRPDTVNQSSSSASNATGDINSEDEEEDDGFIEISEEAKDLIRGLLTLDPEKRLGAKSSDEILHHPWFKGLDPQNLKSPFVPELASDQDTTYFTTRYEFNREDDSDIIADIQDSKIEQKPLNKRSRSVTASALLLTPFLLVLDQSSSFSSPRNSLDYPGNLKFPSSSFSSPKNSPDISVDSESDDISAFPSISQQHLENAFPSISITQLQNKNFQVLRRMSKTRTSLDNINPSRSFAVLSRDSLMPVPKKRTRKSSCFLPSDDMILPAKKLNVV